MGESALQEGKDGRHRAGWELAWMCPAAQRRQTREQILGSGRQVGPFLFGTSEDVS